MKSLLLLFSLAIAFQPACARLPSTENPNAPAAMDAIPHDAAVIRLSPAVPQPQEPSLQPGLAVIYVPISVRRIDQLPMGKKKQRLEKAGTPIAMLDHRFDGKTPLFDSGLSRGIAMYLRGYLRFPAAGAYGFRALSNDGIQVHLGEQIVAEDPGVHAARYTPPVILEIPESGGYEISVIYFQRKGTAAIGLYWQLPGTDSFSPIPASAYRHIP